MRKTRRTLGRKTRRRRQRGGDKRLLYLAMFAWVLAIANAMSNATFTPKLATSFGVYKEATIRFSSYADKPKMLTSVANFTQLTPTQKSSLETAINTTDVPDLPVPKKDKIMTAATGLADLYNKKDKGFNDGMMYVLGLAGETVVTSGKLLDGFFGAVSDGLFLAADMIDPPARPAIEDVQPAALLSAEVVSADKAKNGLTYEYNGKRFTVDTYKNNNDKTLTFDIMDGDSFTVPTDAKFTLIPSTPVEEGGRRKSRRKTLRRKK